MKLLAHYLEINYFNQVFLQVLSSLPETIIKNKEQLEMFLIGRAEKKAEEIITNKTLESFH